MVANPFTAKFRLSAFLILATVSSCAAPKKPAIAPTQTDRILQAYREIQNGRLLILADFEDEKQMELFSLEGATNPGRLARDAKKGKPETGVAALSVTYSSPSESLLMTSPKGGETFLKRDWRPYDLLMMSVNSATGGVGLEIKVIGGVSGHAVEAVTRTTLNSGWNLLRFDLSEIGESVPLDDIQEIRLAPADPPTSPVTLYFDDLLLAGNRRDLLGDSANTAGGLYLQNAGRHWNVGAGGRFELAFRNGQIVSWYNLAADAYRLNNLVRGTSLGPVPVRLEAGENLAPGPFSGNAVSARQQILEMNEVRVVIETVWEPVPGDDAAGFFGRWQYTIYPTGQVFIVAEIKPADAGAADSMALNLAWSPSAPAVVMGTCQAGSDAHSEPMSSGYAIARMPEADAALLFLPFPDGELIRLKQVADPTRKTTSLVWPMAAGQSSAWRAQLVLASGGELDDAAALARAADYFQPGSMRIEIGQALSGEALRPDGFDPGTGCFYIKTDGNRAKLVVEGKKRAVYCPTFQVDGGSRAEAWVYANYLLHSPVIRGPQGDLLFQLPGAITKQVVIEPLFKK